MSLLAMLPKFWLIVFTILALASNAYAENTELQQFYNYLESLRSVAIDFTQTDSRNAKAVGTLIITKPHRFRCNYYAPYPILLLGNEKQVVLYDYSLDQTSRIDRQENMFNFLVTDDDYWQRHFDITHRLNKNELIVELFHPETERKTSLRASLKPMQLLDIQIHEPDGNVITITTTKITNITSAAKELFSLHNTNVYGPPERLTRQALNRKLQIQ